MKDPRQITVRGLTWTEMQALIARADANGRSLSSEVSQIIAAALRRDEGNGTLADHGTSG